jgi:glycosyltransferase involved in cell wall biosynthesis
MSPAKMPATQDKLVTVVIPTRDRAPLLRCCLRSVVAQTWPAIEIVVVDDGSADDTSAMLAAEFPQVQAIRRSTSAGPGGARNIGVAHARGRWILFLDDDDLLHPEHVAALARSADGLPLKAVAFGRWRRFEHTDDGIRLGPVVCAPPSSTPIATLREILKPTGEATPFTAAGLWPRTVFADTRWDASLSTNGDVDFVGRAVLAGYRIAGRSVGMAYYRMHEGHRVSGSAGSLAAQRASFLSSARYRLKWSALLRDRPERDQYASAMREGFMSLMLTSAVLPPDDPLHARLRDAFALWGGRSFFMPAPPRNRIKKLAAAGVLKIFGPRALSALLSVVPAAPRDSSLLTEMRPLGNPDDLPIAWTSPAFPE